jgi:hypothetical protein
MEAVAANVPETEKDTVATEGRKRVQNRLHSPKSKTQQLIPQRRKQQRKADATGTAVATRAVTNPPKRNKPPPDDINRAGENFINKLPKKRKPPCRYLPARGLDK